MPAYPPDEFLGPNSQKLFIHNGTHNDYIDKHGNNVTLSSLFCFPYFDDDDLEDDYKFNNVIIGCHCTITSNKECPSLYSESGSFKSDVNMMQYYASFGKGRPKKDNDDYSVGTAQSWPNCMRNGWGVIPIGASQGGSVAMAVQRYIEQNDLETELPMIGSVCCGGDLGG